VSPEREEFRVSLIERFAFDDRIGTGLRHAGHHREQGRTRGAGKRRGGSAPGRGLGAGDRIKE